jgi:hypothetical protein
MLRPSSAASLGAGTRRTTLRAWLWLRTVCSARSAFPAQEGIEEHYTYCCFVRTRTSWLLPKATATSLGSASGGDDTPGVTQVYGRRADSVGPAREGPGCSLRHLLLAWTDYLVGDRLDAVHPLVRERGRPPDDGGPRAARLVARALRRGLGRAQRPEPQLQRRRERHRVRRRGAGPTPGRIGFARGGVPGGAGPVLLYDAGRFAASVEERAVTDARLRPVWGERLFRVVLTARDRAARGSHRLVVRAGR